MVFVVEIDFVIVKGKGRLSENLKVFGGKVIHS